MNALRFCLFFLFPALFGVALGILLFRKGVGTAPAIVVIFILGFFWGKCGSRFFDLQ